MKNISEVFFEMAADRLSSHPSLQYRWEDGGRGKRILTIPKIDVTGFDIRIECESYGLYPFANGWHGAPWDMNTPNVTLEESCEECLGFIRSLLCPDSSLTILYSGEMPYKWILRYPTVRGPVNDETGLLLYNYFGRKHNIILINRHLPSREDKI